MMLLSSFTIVNFIDLKGKWSKYIRHEPTHLEPGCFLFLDTVKVQDMLVPTHRQEDRLTKPESLQSSDHKYVPRFEDAWGLSNLLYITKYLLFQQIDEY